MGRAFAKPIAIVNCGERYRFDPPIPRTGLNPSNVLAGRSFTSIGLQGVDRRPVPALFVLAPVGILEQH